VPVAKSGLSGVKALAASGNRGGGEGSEDFSLALLENGTVLAWGANLSGQLGNGTETLSAEPVAVCAVGEKAPCVNHLNGVKAIAAGVGWGLALLENGKVVAWGENSEGQLGSGNETKSTVPVIVCAVGATSPCSEESKQLKGVKAVEAGQDQSLALLENGTVVAWGGPDLGNGTSTKSNTPVAVCAAGETAPCANDLSGATAIGAGGEHPTASYALLGSGRVMAWGDGTWYELGDGSTQSSLVPVEVSGLRKAQGIAAGDEQGFAIGPFAFPTVTSISPTAGPNYGGTSVKITGTGFSEVGAVKFGEANAKSFTVNSESSITAVSPAGSGAVDVTVRAEGVSGTIPADRFSYENLPELGRCVKLTTQKGAYNTGTCTTQAAEHKGAYEWQPGAGTKRGFSGKTTAPKLDTASNHVVQCTSANFTGEWTAAKTASVKLGFVGCTTVIGGKSQTCQTKPKEPSEITTEPLEAELGFISTGATSPTVGLDLKLPKATSLTVLTFTCGSGPPPAGEQWTVEGSVIGGITPVDAMRSNFAPLYRAVGATQIPERFTGQPPDTPLVSRLDTSLEKHEERAGLTMPGAEKRFFPLINEEHLELKVR
jgi:hypothetical protein